MSYLREGKQACRMAPDGWVQIRDAYCEALSQEAERKIKILEYEGHVFQEEERRLINELNLSDQRPLNVVRLSLCEGVGYLGFAGGFLVASYKMMLMMLPFLSHAGEGDYLLALVLAGGTAITFHLFLRFLAEKVPAHLFTGTCLFIALAAALLFISGSVSGNRLRAKATGTKAALEARETPPAVIEGMSANNDNKDRLIEQYYNYAVGSTMIINTVATVGLELGASLTFHEAHTRIWTGLFSLLLHRKIRRRRHKMLKTASMIEWWRKEPEIMRHEFERGARLAESKLRHKKPLPEGLVLTIGIAAFVTVFFVFFFLMVNFAAAADAVVVALDLTTSSKASLKECIEATENIINQLKAGSRVVLIPINARSFSEPLILDARLTGDAGLFGERAKKGKREIIKTWREKSSVLKSEANASDLFGAVARATVIFQETPNLNPILVFLSDMRHVARGYNFETAKKIDTGLIEKVASDGLILSLNGVKVWALGVHAENVSDLYWMSLKNFWEQYFKRAGAELVLFTQERRFTYE
jgi:hypothetical protein